MTDENGAKRRKKRTNDQRGFDKKVKTEAKNRTVKEVRTLNSLEKTPDPTEATSA